MKSKAIHARRTASRECAAEGLRRSGMMTPVELVMRLKDLSRDVGGIKKLKQLVDLLAE